MQHNGAHCEDRMVNESKVQTALSREHTAALLGCHSQAPCQGGSFQPSRWPSKCTCVCLCVCVRCVYMLGSRGSDLIALVHSHSLMSDSNLFEFLNLKE